MFPLAGSDTAQPQLLLRSPATAAVDSAVGHQSSLDSIKGLEGEGGCLKAVKESGVAKSRADERPQSTFAADDDDMMDAAFAIDEDMDDNATGKKQIDGVSRLVAALYSAPQSLQDKEALQALQQDIKFSGNNSNNDGPPDQTMASSSTYDEGDVHSIGGALERLRVLTEMQTMLVS